MAWLLKAEPDSRIVKGKDVKFSVDDFESVKTSPWEGVRNYEARNLMKDMKVGEKALFYHSNCKNPGIAAFAEVSKEAYPDYTAWDSSHPYHDPKSDPNSPKWFMVDLTFTSRTNHFVPLALLKHIASTYATPPTKSDSNSNSDSQEGELPKSISYIGPAGAKAIKEMDLINRGRLSIQRVHKQAWDTIALLAERGGWENDEQLLIGKTKSKAKGKVTKTKAKKGDNHSKGLKTLKGKERSTRKKAEEEEEEEDADDVADADSDGDGEDDEYQPKRRGGDGVKRKRKPAAGSDSDMEFAPARRTRTKKTRRS